MMKERTYQFVPFSDKVIWRYQKAAELPAHDVFDSKLYSGEIRLTLTAQTPIFISGGQSEKDEQRETSLFARNARGQYMIPGASLRGLIRQNMQILGLGAIRPGEEMEDARLLFSAPPFPAAADASRLHRDYAWSLGISTVTDGNGETYRRATKVKCGYIHSAGSGYQLGPAVGPWLSISRSDPLVQPWADRYGFYETIWYSCDGERITGLCKAQMPDLNRGYVMSAGKDSCQDRLYIIPAENRKVQRTNVFTPVIKSYENDLKMRRRGQSGSYEPDSANHRYWDLPKKPGTFRPVFYLGEGDRISAIGFDQFLRIPYRQSLRAGLPAAHTSEYNEEKLDYARSIMGFVGKVRMVPNNWGRMRRVQDCYRSRVSVGDLTICDPGIGQKEYPVNMVSPDPGASGYIRDGKSCNDTGFRLSGIKQYWMQRNHTLDPDDVSRRYIKPLDAGAQFSGSIRYRNLHADELGLLLWCLRLDDGCCHTMGMAKPHGCGRVKLQIDALLEYDPRQLYSSITAGAAARGVTEERVEELIRAYEAYACRQIGVQAEPGRPATLRSLSQIQDFLYMKRTVRESLNAVPPAGSAMPTVAELRRAKP